MFIVMFNNMNEDLPITALCIVTDRLKCPSRYTPVFKSYDANTETDLWKDGLFGMGKKINRFICYTKDYPINETYNVIEDIKLLNCGENISGFIPVDKCHDNNEKCFQKKTLCMKVSHRYFTKMAVSDIIILVKSKRPPVGYSFIGEINNHTICVKFSAIPNPNEQKQAGPAHSVSAHQLSADTGYSRPSSYTPELPRPFSSHMEDGFVHVRPSPEPPIANPGISADFYNNTLQRGNSIHTSVHNPLQGIPFELNPIYDLKNRNFLHELDVNELETKQVRSNNLLNRISYDFSLERNLIESG